MKTPEQKIAGARWYVLAAAVVTVVNVAIFAINIYLKAK